MSLKSIRKDLKRNLTALFTFDASPKSKKYWERIFEDGKETPITFNSVTYLHDIKILRNRIAELANYLETFDPYFDYEKFSSKIRKELYVTNTYLKS